MNNLHTKLEVFTLTNYKDTEGNAKYRNWGGLGWSGVTNLPEMSPFDRAQTISFSTLIENMRLSCTVSEL